MRRRHRRPRVASDSAVRSKKEGMGREHDPWESGGLEVGGRAAAAHAGWGWGGGGTNVGVGGGRCRFAEPNGRCRFTEGRTRGGSLPLTALIGSIDSCKIPMFQRALIHVCKQRFPFSIVI
jgi:hypothetical protein